LAGAPAPDNSDSALLSVVRNQVPRVLRAMIDHDPAVVERALKAAYAFLPS